MGPAATVPRRRASALVLALGWVLVNVAMVCCGPPVLGFPSGGMFLIDALPWMARGSMLAGCLAALVGWRAFPWQVIVAFVAGGAMLAWAEAVLLRACIESV